MFRNKTFGQRLLVAAAVVGLTSACSSTTGAGGAQQPIAKEDLVLVASVINTTNPYMASMIEGARALSEELDVPLEIVDSQGSSQTEISRIQAILASYTTSPDLEIQQRAVEFANLFNLGEIRSGVLERMPAPELKQTVIGVGAWSVILFGASADRLYSQRE